MVCMSSSKDPWERVERKLFALWMSCSLELQMAAQVRLLHEPEDVQDPAERVDVLWKNLRAAMHAKAPDVVGGPSDLMFTTLAQYLSLQFSGKNVQEVENILHDELTAVQGFSFLGRAFGVGWLVVA